jgi:hypothetical protein
VIGPVHNDAAQLPLCATCGVEHDDRPAVCAICADERQWVPASGQQWTTLAELAETGHRTRIQQLEPDLLAIIVEPKVGIGRQAYLVTTPAGSLLWDPLDYIDDAAVEHIRSHGAVLAIASNHPHMFGVQVEWSRDLGNPPILVCEPQLEWVARRDPAIYAWRGRHEITPGLDLVELGGHFIGSSVVSWSAGAEGHGVLLSSDTIHANPDRATVTFMRSLPEPHPPLRCRRPARRPRCRGTRLRPALRQLRTRDRARCLECGASFGGSLQRLGQR